MSDDRSGHPDAAMPPLVPQPHGGALYRGGVPGNKGGGRHPAAVRAQARTAVARAMPEMEKVMLDPAAKAHDRARIFDTMARIAMQKDHDAWPHQQVIETLRNLWESVEPYIADDSLSAAQSAWLTLLQETVSG